MQELDRFRRTGSRDKQTINTKNILFIVSGAFGDLHKIIKKRITDQGIGFGAMITSQQKQDDLLKFVKSEDFIEFGFESEFVGRLPVKAIFERLGEKDLYEILKNPNNPIILGKRLDFAAYGINVKFDDQALWLLAKQASEENTGARGLVSVVEKALILYETRLPSTEITEFPVTTEVITQPEKFFQLFFSATDNPDRTALFQTLCKQETKTITSHLTENSKKLTDKFKFNMTPERIKIIAKLYGGKVMTIGDAIIQVKSVHEKTKRIELQFYQKHDINIVLEEDAVDFIIEQLINYDHTIDEIYQNITTDFEFGLKLVRDKTEKSRFFITRNALLDPESFISSLIKDNINPDTLTKGESDIMT